MESKESKFAKIYENIRWELEGEKFSRLSSK